MLKLFEVGVENAAILAFAWLGIDDAPGLWVFAVLYGAFSGAIVSLPPAIVALLSPDLSLVAHADGHEFNVCRLRLACWQSDCRCHPEHIQGEVQGARSFAAATIIGGGAMFAVVRLFITRRRKRWKARCWTQKCCFLR